MPRTVITKAKDALQKALKRKARLYASDEFAIAESLLRAAEDNLKLGRISEAALTASVALSKAHFATTEAELGEAGFRQHLLGIRQSLRNQLLRMTREIDAQASKLLAVQYLEYHQYLNRATDALRRCAASIQQEQLLKAKGEAVQADLILQRIQTLLDLGVALSNRHVPAKHTKKIDARTSN